MKKMSKKIFEEIKDYKNKPLEFLSMILGFLTTIYGICCSIIEYLKKSFPLVFCFTILCFLLLLALANVKRERKKTYIMGKMLIDGNLRPSLMGYIKTTHNRKKEHYNTLKIWETNIIYNFTQINNSTLNTQVDWNFQGRNENKPVRLFRLLTNMNSDGNFNNLVINAKDNLHDRSIPIIKDHDPQTYQRYYVANFKTVIQQKEKYNFTISLKWDEFSSMFTKGDLFIVDPLNYSKEKIEKISIFFYSQLNVQYSINAVLFEIDRDSFEYQIIQIGKINSGKKEKVFVFEPGFNKIYVMKLIADDQDPSIHFDSKHKYNMTCTN